MKALSKGDIFNRSDHKKEWVEVPEWGGGVYVRCLTAGERDEYEESCVQISASGNLGTRMTGARARLAVLACVDECGQPIFTEDDAPELGRKSASAVERICTVARRLSGMEQGAVEQARKNSLPARYDGSSSDSLPGSDALSKNSVRVLEPTS